MLHVEKSRKTVQELYLPFEALSWLENGGAEIVDVADGLCEWEARFLIGFDHCDHL